MTTRLDKTLKRELELDGRAFIVTISPEGLKLTEKGRRKGITLRWIDLVSGDAALAAALRASVGSLEARVPDVPHRVSPRRVPLSTRGRAARRPVRSGRRKQR